MPSSYDQQQIQQHMQQQQQMHVSNQQYIKSQADSELSIGASTPNQQGSQKPPCLNCRLIQMGSAISYGDNRCPQCGDVVPS